MTFLNYIRSRFKKVLSVDTEFLMDSTGTTPKKVICFVYTDIFTGEITPKWENDTRHSDRHFNYDEVLLVCYNAVAEVGCYLKQLHGKPNNIWDCYVENSRLYKSMRSGKGALKLLKTAEHYGIEDRMDEADKEDCLDTILRRGKYESFVPGSYTDDERKKILDYCTADTEVTRQVFIKQVEDIEKKNNLKTEKDFERELWQIQNRGYAMACVSQVERNGIPIDNKLVNEFNKYWPRVKDNLIREVNKEIGVFTDDLKFNNVKFEAMIKKNRLFNWPRLKSGTLSTAKSVLKKYLKVPDIKKLDEIRTLQNMTKLSAYSPSEDGRVRTSLFMFGTVTGRASPSTAKYPFNASKWARNFIKPSMGNVLYYIDYKSQEPAIGGYLSGDKNKIEAYQSGDVYVHTAKMFGMIPPNGTDKTHPKERKMFKVVDLATGYGQGPMAVAEKLNISIAKAKILLMKYKDYYKTYFRWIEGVIEEGLHSKRLHTRRGWQRWIKDLFIVREGKSKNIRNSLMNWPIQSHGAEVLREALMDLTDNHFEVVALVHDAVLIQIPIPEAKARLKEAKKIMVDASIKIVGGPITVEHDEIKGNFVQDEKDQKRFDQIMEAIKNYKLTTELTSSNYQNDSTALYD